MKKYNEKELLELNYKIENAIIKKVDISMADHGCITLSVELNGNGWGCIFGGYCLGHGYLGAKKFDGSAKGLESIARIMDVVGVSYFNDMKGKYIRVATKGLGSTVKIIGNVIKDQWFDIESFFNDVNNGNNSQNVTEV